MHTVHLQFRSNLSFNSLQTNYNIGNFHFSVIPGDQFTVQLIQNSYSYSIPSALITPAIRKNHVARNDSFSPNVVLIFHFPVVARWPAPTKRIRKKLSGRIGRSREQIKARPNVNVSKETGSCVTSCSPVVSGPNYATRYKADTSTPLCGSACSERGQDLSTRLALSFQKKAEEGEDHTRNQPEVRKRWLNSVSTFRPATDYRVPRTPFFFLLRFLLLIVLNGPQAHRAGSFRTVFRAVLRYIPSFYEIIGLAMINQKLVDIAKIGLVENLLQEMRCRLEVARHRLFFLRLQFFSINLHRIMVFL